MAERGTVVITGSTSGIGLATAIGVARAGCRVVIHGRSDEKCMNARAAVLTTVPGAEVETVSADLASLSEVRRAAGELCARFPRIDSLVNNAGLFTSRRLQSADGLEMQFAVNHLSHFLLTLMLLAPLGRSDHGRVVTVSSTTHRLGRIHWRDLQLSRFYNGLSAYGQSKLANVLFAYELQRRAGDPLGLSSYALEPGLVDTDIGEKASGPLVSLAWSLRRGRGVTPEEGAATSVYLATLGKRSVPGGTYWAEGAPTASSAASRRSGDARRLWQASEELCGVRLETLLESAGA